jgi:diguanylate cyclase (GGDEF)-like protein
LSDDAVRASVPTPATLLDAVPFPAVLFAADGRVWYLNRSWWWESGSLGKRYEALLAERTSFPPSVVGALRTAIAESLDGHGDGSMIEFAEVGEAPVRWLRVRCESVAGGGALMLIEDVSAQRSRELELALRADHDPLTNLANRTRFMYEGERMLAVAERHGWGMALLFLDLDGFKEINDTAGHSFGDAVLQQVARRLAGRTRSGDLIARIGGDEFVALLNDVSADMATLLAQRYRRALQAPPIVPGAPLEISASVGVAWFPGAAKNLTTLLRLADAAMYRAKAEGSGVVSVSRAPADGEAELEAHG